MRARRCTARSSGRGRPPRRPDFASLCDGDLGTSLIRSHLGHRLLRVTDWPARRLTVRVLPLAATTVLPPAVLRSVSRVALPLFQLTSAVKPPRTPMPVTEPEAAQAAGSAGSSS